MSGELKGHNNTF